MTNITGTHTVTVPINSQPILRDILRIKEKYNVPDEATVDIEGWDVTVEWYE